MLLCEWKLYLRANTEVTRKLTHPPSPRPETAFAPAIREEELREKKIDPNRSCLCDAQQIETMKHSRRDVNVVDLLGAMWKLNVVDLLGAL